MKAYEVSVIRHDRTTVEAEDEVEAKGKVATIFGGPEVVISIESVAEVPIEVAPVVDPLEGIADNS